MDREEAIEQLQNCKDLIRQDGQDYLDDRDIPLLDMAIEALSAETPTDQQKHQLSEETPTNIPTDLISRADVLALAEKGYIISNSNYKKVCDLINELPSAEAPYMFSEAYVKQLRFDRDYLQEVVNKQWIPCSERVPKEKARVLTYDSMGDIVFGQYDKGRWYWEAEACADYWAKNDGVIAWQPLPTPYKGGEDE